MKISEVMENLKKIFEKEENVFTLLIAFAFIVVFVIGMFKMNSYETQKATIEYVKDGYFQDNTGVSYEEINQKIIELCEQSSNKQQCLRDFLK